MGFSNTAVSCHALLQGISPEQGLKTASLTSPALTGGFFTTSATWETQLTKDRLYKEEGAKDKVSVLSDLNGQH